MDLSSETDAIWSASARAKVQQEFGWSGAALHEKYMRFLADGGWAQPGEKIVDVFADWARKGRLR
jgi:hypothetical protein